MNTELLAWIIVAGYILWIIEGIYTRWRNATPREPNPEPGPTHAEAMAWGEKFEAMGIKPGGLQGLRLEREAILAALRLCRGELKAMRAERVKAGHDDDPSELDLKYAEYMAYTQRLDDVDCEIEEANRE